MKPAPPRSPAVLPQGCVLQRRHHEHQGADGFLQPAPAALGGRRLLMAATPINTVTLCAQSVMSLALHSGGHGAPAYSSSFCSAPAPSTSSALATNSLLSEQPRHAAPLSFNSFFSSFTLSFE